MTEIPPIEHAGYGLRQLLSMTGARLEHWSEKALRQAMRLRHSSLSPGGGVSTGALAQGPAGSSSGANDWRSKWGFRTPVPQPVKGQTMTRFLKTVDDKLVNVDRIVRIEEGGQAGSQWRSRATLDDGTDAMLAGYIDEIERALLPVVAAAPGFTVLRYGELPDGESPLIERLPIVAWRIDRGFALPVTPDDDDEDIYSFVMSGVLTPEGQVIGQSGEIYDGEAAWLKHAAQWAAIEREAKAEREAKLALVPTSPKG